jgi:hypothetical protein
MSKLPILMTASVSTHGMVGADFSDEQREKMYVESLLFYCNELLKRDNIRKVVFVENSGWDLMRIKDAIPDEFKGQIEYVSLNYEEFDVSKGKGYNELLLINKAIEKSNFINQARAFMKVTGRYPIYNLGYYIKDAEHFFQKKGGVFYGDIKDHKVYDFLFPNNTLKWNGHAAYTALFATTVDFYEKNLGKLYNECNDYTGRWVECVWYDYLKQYRGKSNSGVQLRFKREPICGGLQGSSAQTIAFSKSNQSLKSKIMRLVGNVFRILTPWFWF